VLGITTVACTPSWPSEWSGSALDSAPSRG
jgi:hypothetical protein